MKKEYGRVDSAKIFFDIVILPQIFVLVCIFAFQLILGEAANYENQLWYLIFTMAIMQVLFAVIYFVYNKKNKCDFKSASKINFKINVWQILIASIIAIVAIYTFAPLINLLEYTLSSLGYNISSVGLALNNVPNLIITLVCFCILPPIFEELVFRGVIYNGNRSRGNTKAILLSALAFMLIHGNVQQTIYQFALGVVLALLLYYSGSIIIPMIMHFVNNTFIVLVSFFNYTDTPVAITFTTAWDYIQPFVFLILGCVVIVGLLVLFKKVSKHPLKEVKEDVVIIDESKLQDEKEIQTIRIEKEMAKENTFKFNAMAYGVSVLLWISNLIYYFIF